MIKFTESNYELRIEFSSVLIESNNDLLFYITLLLRMASETQWILHVRAE